MKIPYIIIFLLLTILTGCKNSNINGPQGSMNYKAAYFTSKFKDLHVVDVEGTNDVAVTPFIGKGTSVDWFPDGSALIFSDSTIAYPSSDTARVWLYTFRTGQKRLLFTKAMITVQNLSVSPDGQMVACIFEHYDNSGAELSVFNANGSSIRTLTPPDKLVYDLQWSPDGSQIAFCMDSNICTINRDGSNFNKLTSDPGVKNSISYSPGGTRIAYGINNIGLEAIFVINADGSSQHNITPYDYALHSSPEWSPDGKYIACMQYDSVGMKARISLMDPDGKNVTYLSTGAHLEWNPDWVSDGRIVYMDLAMENLYLFDMNGAHSTQITHIPWELAGYITYAISKSLVMY